MLAALVAALTALAVMAGGAWAWRPGAARYGVYEQRNVPVTMKDGTVLRANVYYPARNGHPAAGRFPVLLTQTPYGKDVAGSAGAATGEDAYLVKRCA